MTREEQLDWLCRLRSEIYVFMPKEWLIPMNSALDMAIKALEQEPCDLISRQAAIDALKVAYWDKGIQSAKDDPCIVDAVTDWAIRRIKELPSAQPEQRVLDKIKAEIEQLTITKGGDDYVRQMAELFSLKRKVLQIIDKYKAESEDKE